MAQLSIQHIKGNTYYIPCPTNVGLYVKENKVTLIDTGLDKDIAKHILRCIEEKGWRLKNIFNTHAHADHIGGNAYLVEKTGCSIIAPKGEVAYMEDTLIEPSFLYGGFPFKVLRNKFLMAKPSQVNHTVKCEGMLDYSELEAISLPGHSMDMMGIRTPDGVLFLADSLIPQNILEKYHLFYLWDIKAHFNTLEKLKTIETTVYVPSHGEIFGDASKLIDSNKAKIEEINKKILSICGEPVSTETVLQVLCQVYDINLNATQYVLISNTVKSYLAYLSNEGLIETAYNNYQMTWKQSQR